MVSIALGDLDVANCELGDSDGDGQITVDEILSAVFNALNGCPRFIDNRDGTITDGVTGLSWEKKSDDGSLHDRDRRLSWDDAFAVHVQTLNDIGFAGNSDWRVPTTEELTTIAAPERPDPPHVVPEFDDGCVPGCSVTQCSCTAAFVYWAQTEDFSDPSRAWSVDFRLGGGAGTSPKTSPFAVRAVRE
jgi:hypothetical protein